MRSNEFDRPPPGQSASSASSVVGEQPLLPTRSTNWQHPEAWLGDITSVKGMARHGEEIQINVRRISRFGTDAMQHEEGSLPVSPITVGRQYSLFLIAMETPTARALAAVRCLTRVQLPAWADNFEGRKPSYHYDEAMRRLLTAPPEESHALAVERPRTAPVEAQADAGSATLDRLVGSFPWCASLTPSQRGAVEKAMQQRLSLIQGPPGTGKTYVACAIVAAYGAEVSPLEADDSHREAAKHGVGESSSDHMSSYDAYNKEYNWPPALSRSQVRRNNERLQKKGLQKFDGTHEAPAEDADITGVKAWDPKDPAAAAPLAKERAEDEEQGEANDDDESEADDENVGDDDDEEDHDHPNQDENDEKNDEDEIENAGDDEDDEY